MYILKVQNISKEIKKEKILSNINLNITKGTIFGLVGKNGAGKSTLLKIILGIYKESKGKVYIEEKNVFKQREKALENVGAVVDIPEVYQHFSGRRNLEFFNILGKNISKEEIDEIIKTLNMENYINKYVSTYSLGMKQRLGLAIALISKPKILILDEPTNGLDPRGIKELREIIEEFRLKHGITVILSSHILHELEQICDEVAFITDGTIVDIVKVKDLEKPLEEVFIERCDKLAMETD